MTQLTPEQMKDFENYKNAHEGETFTDEVLREVIQDDVKEQKESLSRRMGWNREYNHTTKKFGKKEVAEEDPENS